MSAEIYCERLNNSLCADCEGDIIDIVTTDGADDIALAIFLFAPEEEGTESQSSSPLFGLEAGEESRADAGVPGDDNEAGVDGGAGFDGDAGGTAPGDPPVVKSMQDS
jgi:hypothetical protein